MPSASAGGPSVIRLIHRSWAASRGRNRPISAEARPRRPASITPANMVISSPAFEDRR
jgi:hypothetical protein